MDNSDRWEEDPRAGQDEVERYIKLQANAAKEIVGLRWTVCPEGDSCILEIWRGEASEMIIFTAPELVGLGSGAEIDPPVCSNRCLHASI